MRQAGWFREAAMLNGGSTGAERRLIGLSYRNTPRVCAAAPVFRRLVKRVGTG